MRNQVAVYGSRFLGQTALVVVLAATAAGCSESSRFGKPLFTGSTQNQREIIGGTGGDIQSMPSAVTSSSISRSDLPPPGGAMASASNMPQGMGQGGSSPNLPAGD